MNNNEIQVIERAIHGFGVLSGALSSLDCEHPENLLLIDKCFCDEQVLALRGLIDSSKAKALPVAYANASGPKSAPRVKELEWKKDDTSEYTLLRAETPVGYYQIVKWDPEFNDGFEAYGPRGYHWKDENLEDLKETCRDEHTDIILSALEEES